MTIEEVINLARNAELQNLSVKDDNEAILGFINLGMIELYKRFPLRVEEWIFERSLTTNFYTVPDDCLMLINAWGTILKDDRFEVSALPINEEDNPYSINLVSWNTLQVNSGIVSGDVSVIYGAGPETYYTTEHLEDHIALPMQLLEALLHYVGYRGHVAVTGDLQAEHNVHYQRFERSCEAVKMQGMYTSDDVNMDKRIENRTFV